MSKVPKSVRILGRTHMIEPVEGLVDDEACYGLYFPRERKIQYDPDQHEVELKDTILHEVIHGVDSLHNLGMTEEQVMGVATGLVAILEDNPKFAQFLLNK